MDGSEVETNNTPRTAFVIGECMIELQPGKSGAMVESTGLPANARCRTTSMRALLAQHARYERMTPKSSVLPSGTCISDSSHLG